MLKLEEISKDAQITGSVPNAVVNVEAIGHTARLVAYRNAQGNLDEQTIFRYDEHRLSLAVVSKAWAFDAARIERIAMQAVYDAEHALGHRIKDVSAEKCDWDITAYVEQSEGLALEHYIEVKGRAKGQDTITVTSNEIRHGLNQKDKFVLAVVVDGDTAESVNYVPIPFTQEPDWAEASKNLDLGLLLARAQVPHRCYL